MIHRLRHFASLTILCSGAMVLSWADAAELSEGKLVWCPKGAKEAACKVVAASQAPLSVSIASSEPIAVRQVGDHPLAVSLVAGEAVAVRDVESKSLFGPEWWLVYVTAVLAAVTGGLFVWTKKLATSAASEARASEAIAAKALRAAEASAQASARAVVVMQAQLDAAKTSAEASQAAVQVMKEQLAATRAPKLTLRLATVDPRVDPQGACVVTVRLHLENTGLSSAKVVAAGFYLHWQPEALTRVAAKVKAAGEHALPVDTLIEVGPGLDVTLSDSTFLWPTTGVYQITEAGAGNYLHVSGRIDYTDESGLLPLRTTTFYRRYKGQTDMTLQPIGNPGLEYNT